MECPNDVRLRWLDETYSKEGKWTLRLEVRELRCWRQGMTMTTCKYCKQPVNCRLECMSFEDAGLCPTTDYSEKVPEECFHMKCDDAHRKWEENRKLERPLESYNEEWAIWLIAITVKPRSINTGIVRTVRCMSWPKAILERFNQHQDEFSLRCLYGKEKNKLERALQ